MGDPPDIGQQESSQTTDDSQAVADAIAEQPQETQTQPDTQAENSWYLAEGIAGQGEKPDWFKAEKYGSVTEQAKGYKELESRFGAFTGAPEEYELPELSDEIKERGIEISKDDPVLEKAFAFAKEKGMNQEGLNELVNLYAETQLAEQQAYEDIKQQEMKALGHNAETRLQNLNAWASKNMEPELFESFQGLAMSAGAVQTLERLVSMTRTAPVNPSEATGHPGITAEEINELQFATDEFGQRKMRNKEYADMVQQKLNQLHGTENHVEIIGN